MVFPDGRTRVFAYGDAGHGQRLTERSVFEIGSIAKTFTATLLAQMAQRGELRLSVPVASLLPAGTSVPSRDGRQITLENLATHRSELPREPSIVRPGEAGKPSSGYSPAERDAFLGAYRLSRDPDSEW